MAPTAASAGWRVAYIELRLIRRSQEGGGRGPTPKAHADVLPALAAVARASRLQLLATALAMELMDEE